MALRQTRRRPAAAGAMAASLLTAIAGTLTRATAEEPRWQAVETIRAAARELALRTVGSDPTAEIDTVGVDDRLRLPACGEPLDASIAQPFTNGRGTIAVACRAPQPWRLFVPVRALLTVPVIVVSRGIQRGEVLGANDVVLERRPAAALPSSYLLRLEDAVGQVVRRTVPAGTVLVPGALEQARLVERGALVTLIASGGPVLVKGQGVALEAAGLNERVRVRTASGRVVEGVVSKAGEVHVGS